MRWFLYYGISATPPTYFILDPVRDKILDKMNHYSDPVWQFLAIKRKPFHGSNASSFKNAPKWTLTFWILDLNGICYGTMAERMLTSQFWSSVDIFWFQFYSRFPSTYLNFPVSLFLCVCAVYPHTHESMWSWIITFLLPVIWSHSVLIHTALFSED